MRVVRIACLLLVLLLAWLQYRWWLGTGGKHDVQALQQQVQAQAADNAARQQRNDALSAEVHDLTDPSSGGEAIEERARNELGMVKPGETFYRVVKDPRAPVQAKPADDGPAH